MSVCIYMTAWIMQGIVDVLPDRVVSGHARTYQDTASEYFLVAGNDVLSLVVTKFPFKFQ